MASTSRNKSSPRLVLPAPTDSAGFLTVQDSVGSPTATPGFKAGAQLGLQALKDVLEAVDTLPCVKYIAGVGVKILEVVDVRRRYYCARFLCLSAAIALRKYKRRRRRSETLLYVRRTMFLPLRWPVKERKRKLKDSWSTISPNLLGKHLPTLGGLRITYLSGARTMNDILSYTKDVAARKTYKKLLYKMEDAAAADALETQLTHAFQLFQVSDITSGASDQT